MIKNDYTIWNIDYEAYLGKEKYNVKKIINYSGEEIVVLEDENESFFLNSKYNTSEFVEVWAKQSSISNDFSIVILFGIADGKYLKKLRAINKEILIVAYEPNTRIAENLYESHYLDEYRDDDKTIILVGKDAISSLILILERVITFANEEYVHYFVSPNYEIIYNEDVRAVFNIIKEIKDRLVLDINTNYSMGRSALMNTVKNTIDAVEQYSLSNVIEYLKKIDKKNIPAIIVSAGPSLDKNIRELNKAKNKAFIIAVDTAMNALVKEEIYPDIFVTVDAEKPIELFMNKKIENVPLVTSLLSNYEIQNYHKGKRFYQFPTESVLTQFMKKYGINGAMLETGGSVANNAYSLAQQCGFTTIIFVGQDLAYPNNQEHSSHSYDESHNNFIDSESSRYFYVEDNFGGKIKTEYNMNVYRKWFEKQITKHPEIHFVNATEGGAKINGADFITLSEAIEKYCNSDVKIDFEQILDEMSNTFNDTEKKEIYEYFSGYESHIKELRKRISDGESLYNKLESYNNKGDYLSKGFKTNYTKITEFNKWVEQGDLAYLTAYTYNNDYNVYKEIYKENDSVYEDIKHIIKNGKKTIQALIEAIDMHLDDMRIVIDEAKGKIN